MDRWGFYFYMPYTTRANILTLIPAQKLNDALDDDQDGAEDKGLLDALIAQVSGDIDGFLASIYPVPFPDPAPAKVAAAALIFVCEAIYARRLEADQTNPYKSRADIWRDQLEKVGHGIHELDAKQDRQNPPGAAVTETAVVNGTTR